MGPGTVRPVPPNAPTIAFDPRRPRTVPDGAEWRLIQDAITTHAASTGPIRILEAGCGRMWHVALPGVDYSLVGVDMDAAALQARVECVGDLAEAVVGDLATVHLPPASFDVIYNSFVLEHVPDAGAVLRNFADWLKPGGLIVIQVPDYDSVFGFATRHAPFWLHVAFYRYVRGDKEAGRPGHGPYRTYYDRAMSLGRIREFCGAHGLTLRHVVGHYRFQSRLLQRVIAFGLRVAGWLTLGRLAGDHNNLTMVIAKNA